MIQKIENLHPGWKYLLRFLIIGSWAAILIFAMDFMEKDVANSSVSEYNGPLSISYTIFMSATLLGKLVSLGIFLYVMIAPLFRSNPFGKSHGKDKTLSS